jgi:protein-disulfide isomerase
MSEYSESPMLEEEIDQNLEGSFPASDPPSWTLGTSHNVCRMRDTISLQMQAAMAEKCLLSRPVDGRDHVQGSEAASITLLMYGAYECPHCVKGSTIVKQLQAEFDGSLRFVFRHFPHVNVHPHAAAAAEVAEAAGAQNKFWEMHQKLFDNYYRLDGLHLVRYAEALGLDMKSFHHSITGRIFAPRVREDLLSGIESGVKGTPTYFINGVKHNRSNEFDVLQEAINLAWRSSISS